MIFDFLPVFPEEMKSFDESTVFFFCPTTRISKNTRENTQAARGMLRLKMGVLGKVTITI